MIPPVSASVDDPLIFEHVVEDDGIIEVYEAWFNNEKKSLANRGWIDSADVGF